MNIKFFTSTTSVSFWGFFGRGNIMGPAGHIERKIECLGQLHSIKGNVPCATRTCGVDLMIHVPAWILTETCRQDCHKSLKRAKQYTLLQNLWSSKLTTTPTFNKCFESTEPHIMFRPTCPNPRRIVESSRQIPDLARSSTSRSLSTSMGLPCYCE